MSRPASDRSYLICRVGCHDYALEVARVAKIQPLLALRVVAGADAPVAGCLVIQGAKIPVLDLGLATVGEPCRRLLRSRIVVLDCRARDADLPLVVGIIVEQARMTAIIGDTAFVAAALDDSAFPWLGEVTSLGADVVRRIRLPALLSREAHAALVALVDTVEPSGDRDEH